MRFHCRNSRPSRRAAAGLAVAILLALCGPGARAAGDDEVDPALLDVEGLELLRALESQPAKAEAADEAKPDPHSAPQAAKAGQDDASRLEALIDEQLSLQAKLAERSQQGTSGQPTQLGDADPRVAPGPPAERELPLAIFDREDVTVPAGTWGNRQRLRLRKLTLDADGDGVPELTRWIDPESKLQIRREEDRNYDGITDAWSDYEWGAIVARVLDSNDDGNPDVWERYEKGRMTSREVDRDDDGVRDAFYRYEGDSLVEEKHDSNNDGQIDLVILYENRLRTSSEEDQDLDGRMDTWTSYIAVDGKEVISRIERDEIGDGAVTAVELFDTGTGQAVIARKDEDLNGDGEIDVVSIYESGRLVRREISDPSLMEL